MLVIATFAAAVSGQDSETAPAPAPGMDAGTGFSLPVSGAIVGICMVTDMANLGLNGTHAIDAEPTDVVQAKKDVPSATTYSESMAPAPAPGMDAGAGFSSPVSGAIVGFSLVVSLFGMAAQVTISKAFFLLLAIAAFAVVSAQESEMAPAPAPGMDAGAGFSLPVSGAVLGFSLALSLLGFLKR
ncbi:hypothetical protein POTOM_051461 [Populus tomentosa]|uniref:Uncharacterized protein n=1 Tax=Populus tomentosa TaxID=118781 RepID=A0A8X7Y5M2_POPTO|nr:hypothetical protein POTOM_051461 [Populus tomentosa]